MQQIPQNNIFLSSGIKPSRGCCNYGSCPLGEKKKKYDVGMVAQSLQGEEVRVAGWGNKLLDFSIRHRCLHTISSQKFLLTMTAIVQNHIVDDWPRVYGLNITFDLSCIFGSVKQIYCNIFTELLVRLRVERLSS